jgi:hypothetical protein
MCLVGGTGQDGIIMCLVGDRRDGTTSNGNIP